MNSLTTPDYTTSSCPNYTNHVLSSYYKSFLGQRISQETCALSTQQHTNKSIPRLLCFIFNSLSNPFHIFIMTRIYSFDTISDAVSDPNNFYKFLSLLLILLLSILMLSIKVLVKWISTFFISGNSTFFNGPRSLPILSFLKTCNSQ